MLLSKESTADCSSILSKESTLQSSSQISNSVTNVQSVCSIFSASRISTPTVSSSFASTSPTKTCNNSLCSTSSRWSMEEYNHEAINWQHIEFVDNQVALDLIAVRPLNIMALVDEESKFPKGSDQTVLNKLHQRHGNNRNYLKPKSDINTPFGLNQFASCLLRHTSFCFWLSDCLVAPLVATAGNCYTVP